MACYQLCDVFSFVCYSQRRFLSSFFRQGPDGRSQERCRDRSRSGKCVSSSVLFLLSCLSAGIPFTASKTVALYFNSVVCTYAIRGWLSLAPIVFILRSALNAILSQLSLKVFLRGHCARVYQHVQYQQVPTIRYLRMGETTCNTSRQKFSFFQVSSKPLFKNLNSLYSNFCQLAQKKVFRQWIFMSQF